ncbi:MAG: DUF3667 domain-containing protein [Chitinophagaceae bacterium]|nr:MAG: DUF3667 domain-containing protein [Chitinophagaceae bacterium]
MSSHTCPNCNNTFVGSFCNNCGQRLVHRITMSHIAHDLTHAFTHTDKGFFYMMGQLFLRPGLVAREYIVEAKRKRYFPPFQYLIILGTIATIIVVNSHFIENTMRSMEQITGGSSKGSAQQAAFMQKLQTVQSKYYNIMIMLQLPFYSLAAFLFYRRKYKYNYAELLTLQTFVTGQHTILSILIMMVLFIDTGVAPYLNMVILLVSMAYHTWVYMQFFGEKSVAGFFKALGSYLLGIIFFFIFAIIIGMIIGLVIMMSR